MSNNRIAFYLIESGRTLEMVKEYIRDVKEMRKQNIGLIEEIGNVGSIRTDIQTGKVVAVQFNHGAPIHPDFKKPERSGFSKGFCYPKAKTETSKKWASMPDMVSDCERIRKEFNIPISVSSECGWRRIGAPFRECGFLYFAGDNGPYALYVPNIQEHVRDYKKERGIDKVNEPAESFSLNIPGTSQISRAEWDLIVAKNRVDQERKAKND